MNDSSRHEISDGLGYSRSLMLSIGIHILLACGLWVGAPINQGLHGERASRGKNSSPSTNPAMPPAQLLSGMSSTKPGAALSQLLVAEPQRRAPQSANDIETGRALLSSFNVRTGNRPKAPSTQIARREPGKPAQLKSAKMRAKMAAKSSSQKKYLAKATGKTKHAAAKRLTKVKHVRNVKSAASENKKANIAETKKLESMREAELRRINESMS